MFYYKHVFTTKKMHIWKASYFYLPAEQWKPINTEEKKKYDREFLLGFQFISASMNKPIGLPAISDVVLDKVNFNSSWLI